MSSFLMGKKIRISNKVKEFRDGCIHEKLAESKPDAGFAIKDAENAISTMEFNGYLAPEVLTLHISSQ